MKTQMHFSMHTESFGGEPGEATGENEETKDEAIQDETPVEEVPEESAEEDELDEDPA